MYLIIIFALKAIKMKYGNHDYGNWSMFFQSSTEGNGNNNFIYALTLRGYTIYSYSYCMMYSGNRVDFKNLQPQYGVR